MSKEEKRLLRQQQQESNERQQRAAEKAHKRAEKHLAKQKQEIEEAALPPQEGPVNVACLIHSTGYDWDYVDRLYSMVKRNLTRPVAFHVYTESDRAVPDYMIKHELQPWPGNWGARKSWWYKLQLFNPEHFNGPMLYLDLDTVIVGNLDWITRLPMKFLWAARDYRYLWRPSHRGINSSVMWWEVQRFDWVWNQFKKLDLAYTMRGYPGDQDYLSAVIPENSIRHFLPLSVMSWRWQILDGGMNMRTRQYLAPNTGTRIDSRTSIMVFHGSPKPHEVFDPVIKNFWQ